MVYMIFAGRYLLPDRASLSSMMGKESKRKFMARLLIPHESKYIGKRLSELPFNTLETRILDVVRGEVSMRRTLEDMTLEAGDRIVLKTGTGEILGLKENGQVAFRDIDDHAFEPVTADQTITMEASVGPNSHLRGRPIKDLKLRRKYGVYLMAVHRAEQNISQDLPELRLQFADTLLLEGPPEGLQRLMEDGGIINLSAPSERATRWSKAPIAIATMHGRDGAGGVRGDADSGAGRDRGAVVVMLTHCVDPEEAFDAIDWSYPVPDLSACWVWAWALDATGHGPVDRRRWSVRLAMLAAASDPGGGRTRHQPVLTEMVSNNAVAVLVGPSRLPWRSSWASIRALSSWPSCSPPRPVSRHPSATRRTPSSTAPGAIALPISSRWACR